MTNNITLQLLNYWRNCLADAARMSIDVKRLENAFEIPKDEISAGQINPAQAEEIVALWEFAWFWAD